MFNAKEAFVDNGSKSADAEGKQETLQVESRFRGKIKKRGRIPIFRNEQRLREPEQRRPKTHDQHFLSDRLAAQGKIDSEPDDK